ncbi:MAG: glycoside-pentoside-hexuronide (GPH):cation symporter [Clostridia bacterium]
MNTSRIKKYPVWRKLFFGAGDIAPATSHTIIAFFFLFYLTDVVGLRPALASTVVLVGKLWDAVSDPLIGHLSDNTRSRFGRRRSYLLYGSLPLGVSFFFLWALPPGFTQWQLFSLAVIAYMVHMTFLTAVAVPYQALLPEMVEEYDERTSFTAYRMLFSILCGLFAVVIPDLITKGFPLRSQGFLVMGLGFAVVIAGSPLFPFFGCYEKNKMPEKRKFQGYSHYLKPILKNIPFRLATFIYFFTWAGIALVETMFLYFFTYWLGRDDVFYIVVAQLFIIAALFLPLWVKLSEKYDKKKCFILGIAELAVSLVAVLFITPETPLWVIFVLVTFLSFGVSAAHVLPHSLIPDCIDYGKLMSRKNNEGIYYGMITFFHKLGVAVVIWISGIVLDLSGYINPNGRTDVVQPGSALTAIRIMQSLVPAFILFIGVGVALLYPISRNRHQAIMRRLEKRKGV